MPTAYNTCIKCCVIKLFFNLHFFGGVGSLTKQDGTLNLPLPFIQAAVAFCVPGPTLPCLFPKGDCGSESCLRPSSWSLLG